MQSSQQEAGEPKLVALVELSENLGWNEMVHIDAIQLIDQSIDFVNELESQEKYMLNAGLTGVVIDKEMIKNISVRNTTFVEIEFFKGFIDFGDVCWRPN